VGSARGGNSDVAPADKRSAANRSQETDLQPHRPIDTFVCLYRLVTLEIRKLIREMSLANPLWGAPRIHGELLKLGVDIGQTSVAKYMVRRRDPPSQGWRTFLRHHADGIVAMDMFVVPTISFRLLYGLLIMGTAATYSVSVVWRHSASNRRMDRKSGHGSMRLGTGSPLSHS
jgi:hypothetical protein